MKHFRIKSTMETTQIMADLNVTLGLDYLEDTLSSERIFFVSGVCMNAFLMIVFNAASLFVLRRTTEINTYTKMFMTSLTTADFSMGWLLIPTGISTALPKPSHRGDITVACLVHVTAYMTAYSAALLSLMAVTFDRYLHISRPLHYNLLMTRTRAIAIVMCCWIWPLSFMISYAIKNSEEIVYNSRNGGCWVDSRDQSTAFVMFFSIGVMIVPMLLVIILYIRMLSIAKQHALRMKERAVNSGQSRIDSAMLRRIPHMKALKTFMLISLMLSASYTPLVSLYIFENLTYAKVHEGILYFCMTIMYANHWLNSVVYYFRTPWFRNELRKLRCRWIPVIPYNLQKIHVGYVMAVSVHFPFPGTSPKTNQNYPTLPDQSKGDVMCYGPSVVLCITHAWLVFIDVIDSVEGGSDKARVVCGVSNGSRPECAFTVSWIIS